MHKTVIFDLGRVLVNFDFERGYRALEGRCPYPAPEIRARIGAADLAVKFETGLMEPAEFYGRFGEAVDLDIDYAAFCEIWNSIFTDALIPDEMLAGLAARYRLLLLSNTNAIHFEMVRKVYPALRHFHEFVLSYELRAMKPDPAIYRAAVARAGCRPEECFYTDDIASFVDAARAFGIDAVQFRGAEKLAQDLEERGIRWR